MYALANDEEQTLVSAEGMVGMSQRGADFETAMIILRVMNSFR